MTTTYNPELPVVQSTSTLDLPPRRVELMIKLIQLERGSGR